MFAAGLVMLLLLMAGGCSKGQFSIELSLAPQVTENYNLLYYASDSRQGFIREQVLVVHQGICHMECPSVNPTLVYVFHGAAAPALVFYAERGDKIKITGDNGYPLAWNVGGNDINEGLSRWRQQNRDALSAADAVKVNSAVARFVKANASDPAAALILLIYYYRSENPDEFDALYRSLAGEAAESRWSELVGRVDMTAGFSPVPRKVTSLTVSVPGGKDTLSFADKGGVIYFSDNDAESRVSDMAELRKLARLRVDSSSFVVADISMEPDSAAWAYQLPRDSLKNVVRAWMPMQFSDSTAASLRIDIIPCFVVIAGGGTILYKGSDAVRASDAAVKAGIRKGIRQAEAEKNNNGKE